MANTHLTSLYAFSISRQDSLVAGKNFVTMLNPVGSGRIIYVGVIGLSYNGQAAGVAYPMRGYRCTAPTGGTLESTSAVCKFDTETPDTVAEIRTNNPTLTTTGAAFFNAPTATTGNASDGIFLIEPPSGFNPFLLRAGEAIAVRQDAGATGYLWHITLAWRELIP